MPIKVQAPPRMETAVYNKLRGVDFSQDALLCDRSHAAYALNLIADKGGLPEKRPGWRILHRMRSPIFELYYGEVGGERCILAHGGDCLYKVDEEDITELCTGLPLRRCAGFFANHLGVTKFYLLAENNYFCYDGKMVSDGIKQATVPVVAIGKPPSGGGVAFQPLNLLTPRRTEKFMSDGSSLVYQLSSNRIDTAKVEIIRVAGGSSIICNEGTDFTVNRLTGQIVFTVVQPAPFVAGEDNIFITYSKTVEGYASRILSCRVFAFYGLGGSNRVFVTGNPKYPAWDWWSELSDPTYFPDLNYSILGSDNTRIMGYSKIGEYQIIIKEDNNQDSTIFIRSAELLEGKASFPIVQGVTGIGAVAPYSFVSLIDEPLFLSRTGVYAVTSNTVTAERTLQNRSFYLNGRLCKEKDLEKAVAVEWNGYYLLCANGVAYLLDSRRREPSMDGGAGFIYEGYYWDNIPANCLLSVEGGLYFGTTDGKFCRFNTDIATTNRYNDDGKEITAVWETMADNDGMSTVYKTMLKKGSGLTIKPSVHTGADIYVSVDGEPFELFCSEMFSLFVWDDMDFLGFTFFTSETPKVVMINRKIKKYGSVQFRIVNDKLNQAFGIYELTRCFTVKGYKQQSVFAPMPQIN